MTPGEVTERPLTREDFAAAGADPSMKGVSGYVFAGPRRTVYAARCDASRWYRAGWWVRAPLPDAESRLEFVRTEKQARALATRWATEVKP